MKLTELRDTWINGNRKDAVEALIDNNKLSDAIMFAALIPKEDVPTLLNMLANRHK